MAPRARVLDGAGPAAEIRAEVGRRAAALRARGVSPTLAVALIGDDAASAAYVRAKERACAETGIGARVERRASATTDDLVALVRGWSADAGVHAILVQLPLPEGIDAGRVIAEIDPAKDVDCFTPANLGRLLQGRPRYVPPTPRAILRLLDRHGIPTRGAEIVVVGYGIVVGTPLFALLAARGGGATVTICHAETRDLESHVRRAEILVSAAGVAGLIKAAWIRPGATVIDVGLSRVAAPSAPRGVRLVGDVEAGALARAGAITPVPGGVGPMTVACLLENVVEAAEGQAG